jgi:hypothetical protein
MLQTMAEAKIHTTRPIFLGLSGETKELYPGGRGPNNPR